MATILPTEKQFEIRDSFVTFQTNLGAEVRATLTRVTRYSAVVEFYEPTLVLRSSEVLADLKIIVQDRTLYSGRAVARNVVSTGLVTVCELSLSEDCWQDVEFSVEQLRNGQLQQQFGNFMQEWQKLYRVSPEYKVIIADMQSFLADLRLWLDQVELGIRSSPSEDRLGLENEVAEELSRPVLPCVDVLFEKFEALVPELAEETLPAHRSYMRRQLHPHVLCAPFAYRTFRKPLGYAGDYEMVNMILRNGQEGGSLFAKVVNTWFLRQPPAQAHRNRITSLAQTLATETLRVRSTGREARIFSVACGPAKEVQRFVEESPLSDYARFTLLDFNEETLQYARASISALQRQQSRKGAIEYVRKSVQQILKESVRTIQSPERQYDCVYCAGLFDYLSDPICHRLMNIMYEWIAPGGFLVATNVEPSNPLRNGMEHLLDWHLIYRTAAQLRTLIPAQALPEDAVVRCDDTGVNLFLEVRKPGHA